VLHVPGSIGKDESTCTIMSRNKRAASAGKTGLQGQPAATKPVGPGAPIGSAPARARMAWALGGLLLLVAALAFWLLHDATPLPSGGTVASAESAAASSGAGTVARVRPEYVDNQLCVGCHQDAARKSKGEATDLGTGG
jgi:hypothetical protein